MSGDLTDYLNYIRPDIKESIDEFESGGGEGLTTVLISNAQEDNMGVIIGEVTEDSVELIHHTSIPETIDNLLREKEYETLSATLFLGCVPTSIEDSTTTLNEGMINHDQA